MGLVNCDNDSRGRPIGYAHSATCDEPGCDEKIDRGLAYACGGMHGGQDTEPVGSTIDPSRITECPTCRQKHAIPKVDSLGDQMDWWDCWACTLCGVHICNVPRSVGRRDTLPCYIKHAIDVHPEVYALRPASN